MRGLSANVQEANDLRMPEALRSQLFQIFIGGVGLVDNATDLYVGQGKWAELADMWQSYYTSHKDNETQALKAIFWISRAKVREGKIDEAKTLLADAIKPMMANAANEQVEVLVQQLADLMAPKRRRSSDGNYEGPTFEEVSAELEKLITPPQEGMNGTAQMRILFAKA